MLSNGARSAEDSSTNRVSNDYGESETHAQNFQQAAMGAPGRNAAMKLLQDWKRGKV